MSVRHARRLLTIGHSYVVQLNRRLAWEMAKVSQGSWEVTVVAPRFFQGNRDLRPVTLQAEDGQPYRLEAVDARLTGFAQLFFYG